MTNIYVLGLSYTNSTSKRTTEGHDVLLDTLNGLKGSAELEVRAGYFGMCVRQRGVVWLCSPDHRGLAQHRSQRNYYGLGCLYVTDYCSYRSTRYGSFHHHIR